MRYVMLVASVLIQACIGGVYAWSEFVPALKTDHGLSTAQTQLLFGCLVAVFTVSMVFAGRLIGRTSPAWIAGAGGLLFGLGYLIASASRGSFPTLFLGISLIAGIGTGFCYVCPLTMCARWFPDHKGLATGIAVAGFGGGAVLLSAFSEMLFERGMDVLTLFGWIGWIYGAVILLAALPLRLPPGENSSATGIPLRQLLRDRHFHGLALGMFAGTFAGLLVIGNLKPLILSHGLSSAAATLAISAFAAGNAFGRIAWGWISDRHGARTIPLSLLFLAAMLLLAFVSLDTATGAVATAALIGIGFGACFVVYAAQTGSHYGLEQVSAVYPLIFLAYGTSGLIGPWAGGWIYDATSSYTGGITVSLVVVLAAVLASRRLLAPADLPLRQPAHEELGA